MTDYPVEFELNRIAENKNPLICLFIDNSDSRFFCTEWTKFYMEANIECAVQHNTIPVYASSVPAPYLADDEIEVDEESGDPIGPRYPNHTKFVYSPLGYNLAKLSYCSDNMSCIAANDNAQIAVCIGFDMKYIFESDPADVISRFKRHVNSTMRKLFITKERSGVRSAHFEWSRDHGAKMKNNNFMDAANTHTTGGYLISSHINKFNMRFYGSSCDIGDYRFTMRLPLL